MPSKQSEAPEEDKKYHYMPFREKLCKGRSFLRIITYAANLIMIVFAVFLLDESYGSDRLLALLIFIPPVLSILSLNRQSDREERNLERRLRKAHLRKELKALSEFDSII